MPHHFLLLHFGAQCPWQPWVAEQAREAAQRLNGEADIVDVTRRHDLAAHHRLFFHFMTVIDETIRIPSPVPAEGLVRIAVEGFLSPPLSPVLRQPEARTGIIRPLTASNLIDTCHLCIPPEERRGCQAKAAWAARITSHMDGGILGFSACHSGQIVGVVEFLPLALIPYPLPVEAPEAAFITCLYSLENGADYRGQILERLMEHLRGTNYGEVYVIAGKRTPYPNGPAAFFNQYGFQPVNELGRVTLREGEDELVLLRKMIGRRTQILVE